MNGDPESELLPPALLELVDGLARGCVQRGVRLATAESCTGGLLAACLTAIPGSSQWFECGFAAYSNVAKARMLGVPQAMIMNAGAVSETVAMAMAEGALRASHADWAASITGIAGPAGGSLEKPVGTVCFAWAKRGQADAETAFFSGSRRKVREQACRFAIEGLLRRLAVG